MFETYFPSRIIRVINESYGNSRSKVEMRSVDASGNPIPWFTYPAIEYLSQFNLKKSSVFEWGCGASTEYFALKSKSVFSVENDRNWFEQVNAKNLPNVHLVYAKGTSYIQAIKKPRRKFDIIVIDGLFRDKCVDIAPKFLSLGGLIILDNAERHPRECKFLRSKGFTEIDFMGFGPIADITWVTSLFFKGKMNIKPLGIQPVIPIGGENL